MVQTVKKLEEAIKGQEQITKIKNKLVLPSVTLIKKLRTRH